MAKDVQGFLVLTHRHAESGRHRPLWPGWVSELKGDGLGLCRCEEVEGEIVVSPWDGTLLDDNGAVVLVYPTFEQLPSLKPPKTVGKK